MLAQRWACLSWRHTCTPAWKCYTPWCSLTQPVEPRALRPSPSIDAQHNCSRDLDTAPLWQQVSHLPVANRDNRCCTCAPRNVAKQFGGQELWRELLGVMKRVADKHGVSMANVALKWVMQQVGAGRSGCARLEAGSEVG